jgi:subfamily B ATP-binding cassette protein MsbA
MTALLLLYEPLKRLTRIHNEAQTGLSAAHRIFSILDAPGEIQSPEKPVSVPSIRGKVEYRNVSFEYEPGRPALNKVNLTIHPGEILALVGHSGGGKTSLANLLPRFYDPTEGEILIDGVNIKEMDLTFLRSQIALVGQNTTLFHASAKHNISYGKPDASSEEIKSAAINALADGFIKELPHGYDENVGEMGQKLSGGQRQRISIARAILKNAPILILDEATSALDAESEKYVQKALDNLTLGKTTLVIAHRLSTIRSAKRVAVVKDGSIVEEGSPEELVLRKGEYFKLYMTQFNAPDSEGDSSPDPPEAP